MINVTLNKQSGRMSFLLFRKQLRQLKKDSDQFVGQRAGAIGRCNYFIVNKNGRPMNLFFDFK